MKRNSAKRGAATAAPDERESVRRWARGLPARLPEGSAHRAAFELVNDILEPESTARAALALIRLAESLAREEDAGERALTELAVAGMAALHTCGTHAEAHKVLARLAALSKKLERRRAKGGAR